MIKDKKMHYQDFNAQFIYLGQTIIVILQCWC